MHIIPILSGFHRNRVLMEFIRLLLGGLLLFGSGSFLVIDPAHASPSVQTDPDPPPAPCYQAAMVALSAQGALYSQGGHLPDDPINPATGRPYPRLGPDSFDCSGLTHMAYAQAGVAIGTTTVTQLTAGEPISCTLADLQGAETTCWALGDLLFLVYGNAGTVTGPGAGTNQHVAIYVGNGKFMDCYNHRVGCILHAVQHDPFYQAHFFQARRIVPGCAGLTLAEESPIRSNRQQRSGPTSPSGARYTPMRHATRAEDAGTVTPCIEAAPNWTATTGVGYQAGCGPPVQPPDPTVPLSGTLLRQFTGTVGWLGQTGRMVPPGSAGVHLHLGLDLGTPTQVCRWPLQVPSMPQDTPPPGGTTCTTTWVDPLQFLPQANQDTLAEVDGVPVPVPLGAPGDPTYGDALVQLPPPGHQSTLVHPPADPAAPEGTWWSPGNDDRATDTPGALGGPQLMHWLARLWCWLFGWLPWSGCGP